MTRKQKFRSIRTKTAGILTILFISLVIFIYIILNTVMLDKIKLLENRYIKEHMDRAENAISSELFNLSQISYDWGAWDDTYRYIIDENKVYKETNLNEYTYSNLNLSVMAYIDQTGKYIFAKEMNLSTKEMTPVTEEFIELINKSTILKNVDPNYRIQGLIILPEGPMMIAACPIIKSNEQGPVRGNIVVGRYLNEEVIQNLSQKLNLDLSIKRIDQLDSETMQPFHLITEISPISVQEIDNDTIGGYSILNDIYKQPAVGLSIKMNREISMIGQEGIKVVLFSFIIASFLFTGFIMLFFDKTILLRLLNLSKEIKEIGNKGLFSRRVKPELIHDELAIVSEEMNSMLDNLEKSQERVIQSEAALKNAYGDLEKRVQERTLQLSDTNSRLKEEIFKREKVQEEIKYYAFQDHLTGLPNRINFTKQLDHSILLSNRMEKILAVLFLDLDGFKMINDTMGHAVGDQLLIEVSRRLLKTMRQSDVIARIGGDEFNIMIENIDDIEAVNSIAEKILRSFDEPFTLNNQDCFISTSIGISIYPVDGKNAESLIKNADIAMYKAKEKGKNQYILCTEVMKTKVIETMKLTNSLYRALERNEFELYYQPQLSCTSNKVVGVEALIRWNHPELGMVYPSEFIPIAEQTGLIISIGEWVLRTACKQNKAWQEDGIDPIRIAVNISVQQFQNPAIVKQVQEILKQTELEPEYLELEITESIAMKEKGFIIETLNIFKDMGIHISIDDFGMEYSSLDYLKQLPVDKIKIDMSFVQGIDVSNKDEAITKSIIVLAKSMGLTVIAEGVESKNQLDFLTEQMCDEIQGFYYHKPMSKSKIDDLMRSSAMVEGNEL